MPVVRDSCLFSHLTWGERLKTALHATCMCALALSILRKEPSSEVSRSGTRLMFGAAIAPVYGPDAEVCGLELDRMYRWRAEISARTYLFATGRRP